MCATHEHDAPALSTSISKKKISLKKKYTQETYVAPRVHVSHSIVEFLWCVIGVWSYVRDTYIIHRRIHFSINHKRMYVSRMNEIGIMDWCGVR